MFRSIIPREEVFFDNFEKICTLMTEAAKHLRTMFKNRGPYDETARRIKGIEAEADELTHRSIETLHKTFVTPLDRQDILRLIVGLDDILDTTEAVSSLLNLYNPSNAMHEAIGLADLLVQGAEKVEVMVGLLRQLSKASDRLMAMAVELNHLENEADQAYQQAIARLFQEEDDQTQTGSRILCRNGGGIIDIAFNGRRHSRFNNPHHNRSHYRGRRDHQIGGRQMGGGLPDCMGMAADHSRNRHRRGLDLVSAASSAAAGQIGVWDGIERVRIP